MFKLWPSLCFIILPSSLPPVAHLHNFLLSSHDKYLHGGTTSIYIMRPSNNRDQAHVSPSANLECKFPRTRNTNTHHRQTAKKHRHTKTRKRNTQMALYMPEFGSSSNVVFIWLFVLEKNETQLLSRPSCNPMPKYGHHE